MAVGFGFSVSDCINAIREARVIITAHSSKDGSIPQYQSLMDRLGDLETSLKPYHTLAHLDESTDQDLQRMVEHLRCYLNALKGKLSKFQESLGNSGVSTRAHWKDSWHKVQFAHMKVEIAYAQIDMANQINTIHLFLHRVETSVSDRILCLSTVVDVWQEWCDDETGSAPQATDIHGNQTRFNSQGPEVV